VARRFIALLAGLLVVGVAFAQVADRRPLQFQTATEEARFRDLTHELRCVMCQNQSIADSDAQIAVDLRREILRLMRDGRSDDEIRRFLVDRYGEFVLYRPAVGPGTWLLWFGPLIVLLAGGAVVWRVVRARSTQGDAARVESESGDW